VVFLKFTVTVSPATIPNAPPVAALGEGVPCLHVLLDLRVRSKSGALGTIRPYFQAAAPMHRTMLQTGVVGVDAYEGESDQQAMGRSGTQMQETSSTHARTTSGSVNAGLGIGSFSIGASASTTATSVSGSRAVSQQIDTTQRQASEERREFISHHTQVENVLTLLTAKYVGTPYLSFSLSPQPLQLLSIDPNDPNLWFGQLLMRRSSGIEGVQEYTAIVLVPKGEDFCVNARLRRVCVLDSPPGPFVLAQRFNFNLHLWRVLDYLDRVYPAGTPLDDLDLDIAPLLPNPQQFPRPVVANWVVAAPGYMIAEVVSPPGPNLGNVSRAYLPYKHLSEIWLEVQRDEYERAVARSPVERGVLLGETRTLDTCFAFANSALTVAGSSNSVTPLTRFIVDPAQLDLGGITAAASSVSGSVRDRAYEAATRWNLLDNRLATLFANRRAFGKSKLSFGDKALLDLILDRWTSMRPDDPQNLGFDAAVSTLELNDAQMKVLKGSGATDLRTIGQLLQGVPALVRYNERLTGARVSQKSDKAVASQLKPLRLPLSAKDAMSVRETIADTLAKSTAAPDGAV
jgi:hypothetical protein